MTVAEAVIAGWAVLACLVAVLVVVVARGRRR